ncbi:Plasmodium exported protein, unknown function [Plasmodium malariae]|uniref:Uncharacterized protein n=1 Tax=Plasmodium malariae TaxID=5858 RepID=A0A1D3JHW8_PLAMA|nr:Plasmodium exported protein, unknown function [Plasmodium malariae]SBT86015.1 Plasmodium exported protein, unknown function [Plasmodium malariae]
MDKNCKLLLFINICTFILLPWICNFNSVMGNFNKYIYENQNSDRTLGAKTYRLLAKNIKEKRSNIVWVNEEIPYNTTYKKSNKCNNKRVSKGKNKQIKKGSINNGESSEVSRRREPSLYTKRNPYNKEKMVNKIFYKNYVRRAANSDFKFLKRSLRIKNGGVCVLSLFYIIIGAIYTYLVCSYKNLNSSMWFIPVIVILIIFWFVILAEIFYLIRKYVQHEKLIRIKSDIYHTAYPFLR